jgi:uncharacterized protein DUF4340
MKLRTTLILLLVVGGLFAFIKFYESKLPTTRQIEEQKDRVVKIDHDKINAIAITNNETKIELRKPKDENRWMIEAPVKDRADADAVQQLLQAVEFLRADDTLPGSEKGAADRVKDFGLVTPATRLKLAGDGAPQELLFGKDAAVEGKTYLRLEKSNTIYVVSNELKNHVTRKADDFRDHKLTDLDATQVNKVVVKTPAGEIEMEKKAGHWQLNKPLNARGDDGRIADLVSQTVNARIDTFVADAGANPGAYGLAEPRGTATFFAEGRDKPEVLQLGQPAEKEKDRIYAKLSTREGVYTLPKNVEEIANIKPNDVRDKHLLRVNPDIVDRINIEPAGKGKIVLARKQEDWTIKSAGDQPANGAEVRELMTRLESQEVAAFVADVASELPKYGLDQPQVKVTLSSYASENTAETKAGEKPILTVAFGKLEGDKVFARIEDEPFVVSVTKAILAPILTDPIQWQDVAIFKYKPAEIIALEITKPDRPAVAVERGDKAEWKLTKGDGALNTTNVDSLCNTLASLKAVRWAGATTPAHGMDKPSLVVAFSTSDKKSHKITIGEATPEAMWYGAVEGTPGTFIVSSPDVSALLLELAQEPASTPAPAVTPAPKPTPGPGAARAPARP